METLVATLKLIYTAACLSLGLHLFHEEGKPTAWATASRPYNFAQACVKIQAHSHS